MSKPETPVAEWTWADLEPPVDCVIAAFTDNVGDEPGQLSTEVFDRRLAEYFPSVIGGMVPGSGSRPDINAQIVRQRIVNGIYTLEYQNPPSVKGIFTQLGRLASANSVASAKDLADQTHLEVVRGKFGIQPSVKLLSDLAVKGLVIPKQAHIKSSVIDIVCE